MAETGIETCFCCIGLKQFLFKPRLAENVQHATVALHTTVLINCQKHAPDL